MSFAPAKVEQTGPNSYSVSHGDDRGLWVEFSMEPVEQTFLSAKEGHPVWKEIPHIRITQPGGKSDVFRPVKMEQDVAGPSDPQRFPRQWQAFQNQQEQAPDGTPVEQWPPLNKAQVREFKSARILTVEQLAAIPDSAFHSFPIMDLRKFRDMAKKWLENAQGGAAVTSLEAENNRLRDDIEALKAQFAELAAKQGNEPNEKRGPGRPRKEE